MKILMATFWGLQNLGGIWTYIRQLSEWLLAHGIEVDVIGTDMQQETVYILKKGWLFEKKAVLPALRSTLSADHVPALHTDPYLAYLELNRYAYELGIAYLGTESYDLIHAQDPISAYSISRVMKRSIPLVTSYHGSLHLEGFLDELQMNPRTRKEDYLLDPLGKYYKTMEQLGIAASDGFIVSSNWIQQLMVQFHASPVHFDLIPYAVDLKRYDQRAAEVTSYTPPPAKKVIAFTGRLEYIKGIHVLLEAAGLLKQRRNDFVIWIAGQGSMGELYREHTVHKGVSEHVVFWGMVDNVPSFLKNVHIYVQPSLQDTQPFSVTEAQLAGVPVIVTDAAGMPDMVQEGQTGYVVPPSDAAALAHKLDYLLTHDNVRTRVGAAARTWAREYRSLERQAEDTLSVYQKYIDQWRMVKHDGPADIKNSRNNAMDASPLPPLHHLSISSELLADLQSKLPADYLLPDPKVLKEIE
ncbi:glycosyltransferase family 4 protein [Paenibacillus sp. Marseille-Q4541]|uniref:glycosyltransferase family 4 protein n=1 Tax=Paenibacillus sp. Marseille-Q4541 TaxID=2831522 RepID=UPI001BABC2AF|nr:glycosyltransferase family 4 protein [Paenibacillus sp. Marseille-Q4541]